MRKFFNFHQPRCPFGCPLANFYPHNDDIANRIMESCIKDEYKNLYDSVINLKAKNASLVHKIVKKMEDFSGFNCNFVVE